jgi:4-amino-4-deoxy-L-arabinose transferase-like glycosyltransferase
MHAIYWRTVVAFSRWDRWLVLFLIGGAALRLHHLAGDLPYVFHYDEPTLIDNAVWMWQHRTLNPHFFNYPTGLIYLLAALFGCVMLGGRIGGVFASGAEAIAWLAGGTYPRPAEGGVLYFYPTLGVPALYLMGRTWSALASTATIGLAYAIARRCTGERTVARSAALFLALSPLAVEHAHLATTDSTAAAAATGALLAALHAEGAGRRFWARAGALAGLAAGIKYNAGLVVAALPLLAVWQRREARWEGARRLLAAAGAAFLVFLLTTPFALFDAPRFSRDLAHEFHRVGSVIQSSQGEGAAQASPAEKIGAVLNADLGVPMILAVLAGGFLALRARRYAPAALLVWVAAALLPQLGWRTLYPRYLLPVWPAILVLAAWGVHAAAHRTVPFLRVRHAREIAPVLACLLVLALPSQRLLVREAARSRPDPRVAMTEWIEVNIPAGERIVLEPGGPFPSSERYSLDRVDFLGRSSPEQYLGRGARYLAGTGRESRIASDPSLAPMAAGLEAIRAASDRVWEEGRYVVYRLRGGGEWEGLMEEARTAGDPARARAILEEIARGPGATPHGWKLLAEARAGTGDTLGALAAYEAAARLDSTDVEIPLAIGNLHLDREAWDAALAQFERAGYLAPRDPLVFHNLAVAHLYRARDRWQSGDRDGARRDWQAARDQAEAVVKFAPGDRELGAIFDQVARAGHAFGFTP